MYDNSQLTFQLLFNYGYFGIYLTFLVEGTGLPIPVQLFFMAAAYFIKNKSMSLLYVVAAATLGNLSGNLLAYYLGYSSGKNVLEKLNRLLRTKDTDIDSIKKWFERYGGLTNMISRWIGITRTPAIWAAGLFKINIYSYAIFSFLGDFIWAFFWVMLYIKLYSNLAWFYHLNWEYKLSVIAPLLLIIFLSWQMFFNFLRKRDL